MNETTLTTKEVRARLKAAIKAQTERSRAARVRKNEAKAAGDTPTVNALHWERIDEMRPEARAMFIAYGYLKGRTYHQVENKTRPKHQPDDYGYRFLDDWENEDAADISAWVKAGDKTRFEIEVPVPQEARPEPVKAPEPEPAPQGLLARLRAAVGA